MLGTAAELRTPAPIALASPGLSDEGEVRLCRANPALFHTAMRLWPMGSGVCTSSSMVCAGAPGAGLPADLHGGFAYTPPYNGPNALLQWMQPTNPPAPNSDEFFHLATHDDITIVGTPWHNAGGPYCGAVRVFERTAVSWIETLLVAPDPALGQQFGRAIDLVDDVIAVGVPICNDTPPLSGAVWIFNRVDGQWVPHQKLYDLESGPQDYFGSRLCMNEDWLFVTEQEFQRSPMFRGSVLVFRRKGADWVPMQRLLPIDPIGFDGFGESLDVDGDRLAVGAIELSSLGSVYVFELINEQWVLEQRIVDHSLPLGYHLGIDVDLAGDRLIVGMHPNNSSQVPPVESWATLYQLEFGQWRKRLELSPLPEEPSSNAGYSVALLGDHAFVGAPLADGEIENQGALFVYDLTECLSCAGDLNLDGDAGFEDLIRILSRWNEEGGEEDLDDNGLIGLGDVLRLLSVWGPCGQWGVE